MGVGARPATPPLPPTSQPWAPPTYPGSNAYGARPTTPRNGMGIAGLVLGILSLLIAGFILGILAIIFSSIGIQRANSGEATNKNMAIWGLVLGIIGLVGWTLFLLA